MGLPFIGLLDNVSLNVLGKLCKIFVFTVSASSSI